MYIVFVPASDRVTASRRLRRVRKNPPLRFRSLLKANHAFDALCALGLGVVLYKSVKGILTEIRRESSCI